MLSCLPCPRWRPHTTQPSDSTAQSPRNSERTVRTSSPPPCEKSPLSHLITLTAVVPFFWMRSWMRGCLLSAGQVGDRNRPDHLSD